MVRITVIIPTFNRAKMVSRAIHSVLSQDVKDIHLIVVDDGSTDETRDVLAAFGDRIRHVRQPYNRGVSAARNTGIRLADTPYVAFLDSDDFWRREKLKEQIRFFGENPSAVACQTEETWIRNGHRVNPKKQHAKPSGDIFAPSLRLCLVSPSAVMLRTGLFDEVGLFDESLPACEDFDLWLRIACRHPVHLLAKPLVVKEGGHADQLSRCCWGLDRFRIRALVKLLSNALLDEEKRPLVLDELARKCRIYGNGCRKRGKTEEGAFYLDLSRNASKIASRENFLDQRLSRFDRGWPDEKNEAGRKGKLTEVAPG
jgi:glycosyltransferase involved in cell wall biosynthesis